MAVNFEIIPAHDLSLAAQAATFTTAFDGYVGGLFAMDAAGLGRFLCAQGADLCYSRFARNSDGLCGFGYITRVGEISRLAGMGVVPSARRSGAARALLLHLLEEARARGDRMMVLEVIEQNPPACALYRREGFREVGRLCGWRRPAQEGAAMPSEIAATLKEISIAAASQLPAGQEFSELPWAISRHAIAKMISGRAYFSGRAVVVIGDPAVAGPVRIHALASAQTGAPDWAAMRQAFASVLALHRAREFFAPPVFPEEFGEKLFLPLGFAPEPLGQFLMRYDLQK
ncbi:MAG: GNAT family N-acetyltransferase [Chthoniobacterales bacterium]